MSNITINVLDVTSLKAKIYNLFGKTLPIKNADVFLCLNNKIVDSGKTNKDGSCMFKDVLEVEYVVKARYAKGKRKKNKENDFSYSIVRYYTGNTRTAERSEGE